MISDDLALKPVTELAALIKNHKVSPRDVVEAYLGRIKRYASLHAYVTVCADEARTEAKAAERAIMRGKKTGPLTGIPIGVKDQIEVRGTPTTLGSHRFKTVAKADATAVARLRAAGAIIIGKQNCTLLSAGDSRKYAYGRPVNPWSQAHDSGGSSNGSAVAVAAGLSAAALGEDTGGSIRVPASYNGAVGVRPSWGRVSRRGVVPIMWSADTVGPLTRTVQDSALILRIISGHDAEDEWSAQIAVPNYLRQLKGGVRGMRVGIVAEYRKRANAEVNLSIAKAADALRGLGARVSEVSLPMAELAPALSMALGDPESAARESRDPKVLATLDSGFRQRMAASSLISASLHQRALQARGLLYRELLAAFERFDVLISPCAPTAAPKIESQSATITTTEEAYRAMFRSFPFTMLYSLAGAPAISVPCRFTKDGLPIGLQMAAKPFDEATLLRAAYAYEQVSPAKEPWPTL